MKLFNKAALLELVQLSRLHYTLASIIPEFKQRKALLKRLESISRNVPCPHNESEILSFGIATLSLPKDVEGSIVEAGSYKGGGTAKFSIFSKLANRKLVVFDSFEGLPQNTELHERSILGHSIENWFEGGEFEGSLQEVKNNVKQYGELEVCTFIEGWFENSMPTFTDKIAAAYLDVDLASSTKTCLKFLYPLLSPGGVLYSQDGDFPLVVDVFNDTTFWEKEVGVKKPRIEGLGKKKLIKIVKESS